MDTENDKKVLIIGWLSRFVTNKPLKAYAVHYSPNGEYVIIELFKNEVFVAGKIMEVNAEGCLIVEYSDSFEELSWEVAIRTYSIGWGCIKYGFAKIFCNEYDCSGDRTITHRIWFDKELYRKCREEMHPMEEDDDH